MINGVDKKKWKLLFIIHFTLPGQLLYTKLEKYVTT